MTCEQAPRYLHAYLDDELGVADAIRFEEHMAGCIECQTAHRQSLALRSALRGADLYYHPSETLAARVSTAIRGTATPPWHWIALAAAIILAVGGMASLWVIRNGQASHQELLARAVVDSHIRSLQASHLVDVPSSDHHTVKPWFQGKLDFSPPVPDLAAQGWTLAGGRLDYLDGKPVAALVYQRRQHEINLFLWRSPQGKDEEVQQQSWQGYQVLHWTRSGMTYWVTSDLNPAELLEFAQLVQSH